MIERGLGYWIDPGGDVVPLPPRASHADLMRELVRPEQLADEAADAFVRDPNAWAVGAGWVRLRIYPGEGVAYADLPPDPSGLPLERVEALLDAIGIVGLTLKYTDADGNYVSP